MAFIELESWRPEPRVAQGPLGAALASWGFPARRAGACLFSILVHVGLLFFLINKLADVTLDGPKKDEVLAVFDVVVPGPSSSDPDARAQIEAPVPVPAAAPTVLDLSQPSALPAPEWSMTRMRVKRAPAAPNVALASAGGAADGAGSGGSPRLSQFVGFGDGIGGQLLLDQPMLEAARRAAMRAFPEARGTALIFLRVSPGGTVMGVVIKGGGRDIGLALRRELIGKKLFMVRSAISESALVALPPVRLSADT